MKITLRQRPAVGVGLFVLDGSGRVLLFKRRGSHGAGSWGLPGGHLEHGSTPEETACAEAAEEVGLSLSPLEIRMGPYTNDIFLKEGKHYVTLFASCFLPEGQQPTILEPYKCSELNWFDLQALPEPLFLPLRNFMEQPSRPPFSPLGR